MKFCLLLLCATLISGCSSLTAKEVSGEPKELDSVSAEAYALYAMMASNAYLDKDNRTYFPIEQLGWIRVDQDGNPTDHNSYTPSWIGKVFSNLQFDVWEHKDKSLTVISFKGTDEKIDWLVANFSVGISIPYKSAKKHVKRYMKNNSDRTMVLTGHSLGGGLALSVSLWEGVDAYVFNSSPRLYDGWGDHNEPATRKAIYHGDDFLQKIRGRYPKFLEKIPAEDTIKTNFDYGNLNTHRADLLAEGILRCAFGNAEFAALAKQIPEKVQCNF
jgi:hypothetical protein